MNQIISFIRLQQIDTRLDQVRARLHQIKVILQDNKEIQNIQQEKNTLDLRLNSFKTELLSSELAVKDQQVKIQQTEATLYGGKIVNPKELQDIQLEIAMQKRQLNTFENKQLELMIALEETQKEYESVCSKYSKALQDSDSNNLTIISEQNTLLKEVEKLNSEKKAAEISLSILDLSLYNKLRTQRGGLALSVISEGACNSCGATLTPAQNQAIKSFDQIIFCPSCGRILYTT
jgi:predicted  nucleic acid-binding Zn-ribbon protein